MTSSHSLQSPLFPDDVVVAAQNAQKATGCLASVTLAQWAQESGFGKFQMHANNPFGIKWYEGCKYGFVSVPTREFLKGQWVWETAKFVAFPSLQDAFLFHGEILMDPKGPYRSALPLKDDWQKYIQAVAKIYATDPNYAKALISLVQEYGLNRFDVPEKTSVS